MERADERLAYDILRHQGVDPYVATEPSGQKGGGDDDNSHFKQFMQMMMSNENAGSEQHQEKQTMQVEEMINKPAGVRAAGHCQRQCRRASRCETLPRF